MFPDVVCSIQLFPILFVECLRFEFTCCLLLAAAAAASRLWFVRVWGTVLASLSSLILVLVRVSLPSFSSCFVKGKRELFPLKLL